MGCVGRDDVHLHDRARRIKLRRDARGVHRMRDAKIGREETRRAQGDERAAVVYEFIELLDALHAHAARCVLSFPIHAKRLEFRRLHIRERLRPAARFRRPAIYRCRRPAEGITITS